MRDAPLEERSITQLRAMAQAMGAGFSMGDDKNALIQSIRLYMENKTPPPRQFEPLGEADGRMTTKPPRFTSTREEMQEIAAKYVNLHISFPTADTWFLTFGKRENSGTMKMPLRDFDRLVREFVR